MSLPPVKLHSSSQKSFSLSTFIVSESSQSINTGSALIYFTGFTAAINVSVGTITSSSFVTPQTSRAMCSPDVPF